MFQTSDIIWTNALKLLLKLEHSDPLLSVHVWFLFLLLKFFPSPGCVGVE